VHRGFTLIELMITVAVIALLAAIGYPSYTEYVQRGKIAEATGELGTMRVRLEQFYQDNRPNNYGSTAAACGVPAPTSASFSYSCNWGAGGTNQGFLVTATGNAAAGMSGFTFTIDHSNAQRTTAYPGASGLPAACWLKRKSDGC
jgi:type IV pilus assembly protein PilE